MTGTVKDASSVTHYKVYIYIIIHTVPVLCIRTCMYFVSHKTMYIYMYIIILLYTLSMIVVQIKGYWDDYLEYSRVIQGQENKIVMEPPKSLWKAIPHL